MYGWMGKILRIKLTDGSITEEPLGEETAGKYLGGRGLGTGIIYAELAADTDPLGEDNKLVFAVGPLTGTGVPTSGRMSLSTRSPLTGTIFDSNGGGFWGPALKAAGFDALIVEGRAAEPVHLVIENGKVEIHKASFLKGRGVRETDRLLKEKLGSAFQNLMIGPAGENQVRIAGISVNGNRSLGRGGVGAVLGSKNLKAISVKGNRRPEIYDRERFEFVNYEADKWLKASPLTSMALPRFGTSMLVNLVNEAGALPTRNFQQTRFEGSDKISGEALAREILIKNEGCYNCPIRCGRKTRTAGGEGYGPEYETIGLLGSNLGISSIEAVAELNYLAGDLGLDTISLGGTISCLMEMAERGLIDYEIRFGDFYRVKELLGMIALRDGPGDELAEGSRRFAEKYNASRYAMQVKGLEIPAYDPRGMKGRGLGYITSNRGACHLRGNMLGPELLGVPKMLDRFAPVGKSGILITQQNFNVVIDSLIVCKFTTFAVGEEFFARLFSAVTGLEKSQQELLDIGEQIWTLERLFNLKAGFTAGDDRLPERFLTEPGSGPAGEQVFEQEVMLDEYYRSRGWDQEGIPTVKKMKALGLEGEIAKDRASPGKEKEKGRRKGEGVNRDD